MSADLSQEVEHLLIDLAQAEFAVEQAREKLANRQLQIASALTSKLKQLPAQEARAAFRAAAEELAKLQRGRHRSELAELAAEVVKAYRRRAKAVRNLDVYPAFGEVVPAIDLAFEHDGERGFTVKTGGGQTHRFTLPAIIDRGVWRGDGRYERGDAVTSGGQLWIAREDNPTHEPGKGPQWRLAVTRGRPGRDAPRGARGPAA